MKCPRCNMNLKDNIGFRASGTMYWKLELICLYDDKSQCFLDYEEEEFVEDKKIGGFFCKGCDSNLDLTEKEVIEILKGGD